MPNLVALLLVCLPLTGLAVPIAGHAIEPAWFLTFGLALVFLLDQVRTRGRVGPHEPWALCGLAFLAVGSFALLGSPFGTAASRSKGMIQVIGLLSSMGTALAIVRCVGWRPVLFRRFLRILVIVMTTIAAIGVYQFFVFNVLRVPALGEFWFLAELTGNPAAWRDPGMLGGVARVNSIAAEPAHLSLYLGTVSGLACMRLGLLGRRWASSVADVVRPLEAGLILACLLMTQSIIGYGLLVATVFSLVLFSRPLFVHRLVAGVLVLGGIVLGTIAVLRATDSELGGKLSTLPTAFAAAADVGDEVDSEQISALAVLANRSVVEGNLSTHPVMGIGLGAHPEAFAREAPRWDLIPGLLNAEDASGLLLRLLSETGVLGLLLFTGVWILVLVRARRFILLQLRDGALMDAPHLGPAVAVSAACLAVFLAYLGRMGVYYAPTIWILLGITSSIRFLAREPESEWAA